MLMVKPSSTTSAAKKSAFQFSSKDYAEVGFYLDFSGKGRLRQHRPRPSSSSSALTAAAAGAAITAPKRIVQQALIGLATQVSNWTTQLAMMPIGDGDNHNHNDDGNFLHILSSPRARACLFMALAMALHFGGYEFLRASNMSLFTSPKTGFTSPAAFPLALALVSPFSLVLLMAYGNELDEHGPQAALRTTTLWSVGAVALTAVVYTILEHHQQALLGSMNLGKLLVGMAFIFQNSYAHLLYTQQWSFLTSVMTPAEGSRWFASIAGLSSLVTTCTGSAVGTLVDRVGLNGLAACTVVTLVGSLWLGDAAYRIASRYGFDPADEMKRRNEEKEHRKAGTKPKSKSKTKTKETDGASSSSSVSHTTAETTEEKSSLISTITKARRLFQRVPTLGALFWEVLSFQSLSTILNVCMVTTLKSTITDDTERARWTGQLYAGINGVSGAFQFILLPLCMKHIELRWAWRIMPLFPLACTLFTSIRGSSPPSLPILAFAFFAAKTMDYSLRGVSSEMVYVPLDFESRYVGKEIIGVLANRFGKSGMSLLLSGLSYVFAESFGMTQLTQMSALASMTWLGCSWWLSALVPKQQQDSATGEGSNSRSQSSGGSSKRSEQQKKKTSPQRTKPKSK